MGTAGCSPTSHVGVKKVVAGRARLDKPSVKIAAVILPRVRPLRPTSIKLEADLIARLTQKGKKRGLPYQTMLKLILRENIDRY